MNNISDNTKSQFGELVYNIKHINNYSKYINHLNINDIYDGFVLLDNQIDKLVDNVNSINLNTSNIEVIKNAKSILYEKLNTLNNLIYQIVNTNSFYHKNNENILQTIKYDSYDTIKFMNRSA